MKEKEDEIEQMFLDALALDIDAQPKRVAEILQPDANVPLECTRAPAHSLTLKCGDDAYIVTVVVFKLPQSS